MDTDGKVARTPSEAPRTLGWALASMSGGKMKRIGTHRARSALAVLGVVAIGLLATGAGGSLAAEKKAGGTLTIGLAEDPDALDPNPVCVGPFKFTSRTAGDRIVLDKSQFYYARSKGKLNQIIFRIITDTRAPAPTLAPHA